MGAVVTAVYDAANAAVGMQRCGLWVVVVGGYVLERTFT